MGRIAEDVSGLVGETPLVRLGHLERTLPQQVTLLAKLEWLNPTGSDKDRVAVAALDAAIADGLLAAGAVIVEPTSGNIGLSLSALCAARGYRLILTMPDVVPEGRIRLLRALGTEIVLTPGVLGMRGAVERAERLLHETPNSWSLRQFENPVTAAANELLGEEIWRQTQGSVDVLVAGVATGGIITGAARALKRRKPRVHSVAVQPAASPVLTGGTPAPHRLYGLGAPFVPQVYDSSVVDTVIDVADREGYEAMHRLMREEGLLGGPSSGAAVAGALEFARGAATGTTIVVVLPDSIERYCGTDVLADR
ncbi:MAG TPA: cysteine synthase family protein [Ardenticatenaceae bacterium]|nr:cysteine synthase family protein [Ardenticatenaceae bacterium]